MNHMPYEMFRAASLGGSRSGFPTEYQNKGLIWLALGFLYNKHKAPLHSRTHSVCIYVSKVVSNTKTYPTCVFLLSVFTRLVERILEKKLPRRCGSAAKGIITVFQFWSYLEAEGVNELETHITELAEEGMFVYGSILRRV